MNADFNTWRQETSVIGYVKSARLPLYGWAKHWLDPSDPVRDTGLEKHATKMVAELQSLDASRVCKLPRLPIIPVEEGHTEILRDHL